MAEGAGSREWKDVTDKLSALEDLQNINHLDMINLKNEIDKIRLASSTPIPPDIEEKIVELEKIAGNVELLKKWKKTIDEVEFLRSTVMGAPVARGAEAPPVDVTEGMRGVRDEIQQIRNELQNRKFKATEAPPVDVAGLRKAVDDNRKTIETLKSMVSGKEKQAMPGIDSVRKMVDENRKLVENLKATVSHSFSEIPADARGELESLHSEISRLEERIKEMNVERSGKAGQDEISSLRKELFTKLEDLNTKFSSEGSEKVENAVSANKESIEKLRALISGESKEDLKAELDENRKFMEELKRILLVKKPGTNIVLPKQDAAIKRKLTEMEKNVEVLGRKLEKMSNLKPIKLPEFKGTKATKVMRDSDVESLRNQLDMALAKMDGFVSKEEVEKGFLEKRMKTDEKLVKDNLYDELNEIKKAIVRNEDHINNIVSDVEEVKKEVSTVEKREWGKVEDMPDIVQLKSRIEELEKVIRKQSAKAVFIE